MAAVSDYLCQQVGVGGGSVCTVSALPGPLLPCECHDGACSPCCSAAMEMGIMAAGPLAAVPDIPA